MVFANIICEHCTVRLWFDLNCFWAVVPGGCTVPMVTDIPCICAHTTQLQPGRANERLPSYLQYFMQSWWSDWVWYLCTVDKYCSIAMTQIPLLIFFLNALYLSYIYVHTCSLVYKCLVVLHFDSEIYASTMHGYNIHSIKIPIKFEFFFVRRYLLQQ